MTTIVLNEQDYYRKVYGGWLGKNIGGTLGAPVEGKMELLQLTYYPVLPDGPLENDDLDLQLVWLHALEQYGARLTAEELGKEWVEHVFFPFDEYGYALTNLRRGLAAPVAGSFNNPFADCMGSPIRSEIWAMAAPAAPSVAAYYAYQDAIVDHAGGEGVYGEMLFAAMESAAFVESDRDRLIAIGLAHIPPDCRTALAVRDLLRWHGEGVDWLEARRLVLAHHGSPNFTDAPQNIAFTILGWLYGADFEDCILKAVNCGYDTDCTAATLGALLGMILGPEGLPERWVKPVGDRIVVSPPIKGFPVPANLDELTRRTMRVGREVLAVWDAGVAISRDAATSASASAAAALPAEPSEAVRALWRAPATANRFLLPQGTSAEGIGVELTVDYGEEGPSIARGGTKRLALTLANRSREAWEGAVRWELPAGWSGAPAEHPFALAPGEALAWEETLAAPAAAEAPDGAHRLALLLDRRHDGDLWATERVGLALVAASRWRVSGPGGAATSKAASGSGTSEANEAASGGVIAGFAGDRLDFAGALGTEAPGVYRAESKLHNPRERAVRLIAGTASPVKLWLNGKLVIDAPQRTDFMPAYHRAPQSKLYELVLPAGAHDIAIEAVKDDEPLELYVLPVAQRPERQPGPFFYLTGIRFDVD
ncbi:ADP-ribosylglycohydrolase family protein [Paenibacillus cymbidii]|uniref:ADP-ribosylglycohydrolase family protein n=1 Tax=Paenibacillus cymbidii TaxID=1639034 RepID=UPI001436B457|nr:ADP-ribosylglycohydrolase family protein [Paenibacillus cymbidii]